MNRSRGNTVGLAATIAVCLLGGAACGVTRDAEYFELLGQFGRARSQKALPQGESTPAWAFEVPLGGSGVVARVVGRKGMDVVRVHYSDEPSPRTLYEYVDYSNPIDVRVDRAILYIYWSETLFSSTSYVLAYDLGNRKVLAKRPVDPQDVPQS